MRYHIHDAEGRILDHGIAKDPALRLPEYPGAELEAPADEGHPSTNYYADGVLTERPANPTLASKLEAAADGADEIALTSYPEGAAVRVEGEGVLYEGVLQGGADAFATTLPGEYLITVRAWPAVTVRFMVRFT